MENIWMLLQQTVAGGLCALFLLLLQRIFRNLLSPRWQYGIWGVLVLRLLIPVGAWGRSTVLDVWPWLEAARAGAELTLDSAYSSPWTLSLPQGPIPLLPAEPPRSLTDWLFLLYLAGALGLALWYLGCALRLSLRVSRGVPVEGPRRAAIDAVAQRYQLPRPRRVVECRWERSPFLMGFFAPALVLPMGWEPDEKVILHELLHLKHRDLWAGWLTAALRCLHWCDPLLWLVFDKVDNDREALCDQRVLERLEGEDRRDYGRVLLSMADSRTVRVPGATTMANGARAIQARIQAIARFKRFPRGMALVSGCMGTALVMALAVGGPAPGGETDPVTVSPQGCGVPGILATAERSRAATVAGALDAYGKAMLHRLHQPALALLCRGITVQEDGLPQALEQYREALRLPEEHPEQLHRWWRSGPVFRGLASDGRGGFLCQVFWFRDQEMQVGDVYPREDGTPWPVEYLCHTVRLLPDGPYWTVEKLAETEGLLENGFYDMQLPLCGPVTPGAARPTACVWRYPPPRFWRLGTAFWAVSGSAPPAIRPPSPSRPGKRRRITPSPPPLCPVSPAFPPYTAGWWSPGRTPAASSAPTWWTSSHTGMTRTLWTFTRPMIMQTRKHCLRPPWKTAPPSTSGMNFIPWRPANRSRSMRGAAAAAAGATAGRGICASTPPRTALPPV